MIKNEPLAQHDHYASRYDRYQMGTIFFLYTWTCEIIKMLNQPSSSWVGLLPSCQFKFQLFPSPSLGISLSFPPPSFAPQLSLSLSPSTHPSLPHLLLLSWVRFSPVELLPSVKSSRCPGFRLSDSLCQPSSSSSPVSTPGLGQCRGNWVDSRINC